MKAYKIVLADDHPTLRQTLKAILTENKDLAVIAEVSDGLELLDLLHRNPALPDMVILDISTPKLRGIEAARQIRQFFPSVKVLILTVDKESEYVSQALLAGADGYLLKADAYTELPEAIRTIRRGESYKSPLLKREANRHR